MKNRAPYPVVLTLTAIIAASFGVYYLWNSKKPVSTAQSPTPLDKTSVAEPSAPAVEDLRAAAGALKLKIDAAWSARHAALGAASTEADIQAAAEAFSRDYAANIAELERLSDAEIAAPYMKYVKALSTRAAGRVAEYDSVRAKLRSGELRELPDDLAPPPLPEPAAPPPEAP